MRCPVVPLILGFVLGGTLEDNLRRALSVSNGDWWTLVDGPVTMALWFATLALLAAPPLLRRFRGARQGDNV